MNYKNNISDNLVILRKELGYTQADLAEILDVSTRMIHNYESGKTLLPIENALKLSEKFNYSLDWLYGNCTKEFDKCDNFLTDIRNLIYRKDDSIVFSISESYWEYIKTVNNIKKSDKTSSEKQREILELKANYEDKLDLAWEFSIEVNKFDLFYKPDSQPSCPYIEEPDIKSDISKKQKEECINFLNSILDIEKKEE